MIHSSFNGLLFTTLLLLFVSSPLFGDEYSPLYSRKEMYDNRIDSSDINALLTLINGIPTHWEGGVFWNEHSKRVTDLQMSFSMDDSVNIPDVIGDLGGLEKVNFSNAKNIALPESFGTLQKLKRLKITHTKMSRVPMPIFKCTSLVELKLSHNRLTEVPDEIRNLKNIWRGVYLNNNRLKELPPGMGELTRCRGYDFHLNNNRLKTLPVEMDTLFSPHMMSKSIRRYGVKRNLFENPFHIRDCPPHFQKLMTSMIEEQTEPFFMYSVHNTFGRPLGYSMSMVIGFGVYRSRPFWNERIRTAHFRKKTLNMYLYKKGFHALVEPGVRGIRFGGGINWLPIKNRMSSQVAFRFLGVRFWDTEENRSVYGSRLYVGPELGFNLGASFRVGYLKELEGDRYVVSIQGGVLSYWVTFFSAMGIVKLGKRIDIARYSRKKRREERKSRQ